MVDEDVLRFIYSVLGLTTGAASIFAGLHLFLRGVVYGRGKGELRLGPAKIDFNDIAPGILFAMLGVMVIYLTRL